MKKEEKKSGSSADDKLPIDQSIFQTAKEMRKKADEEERQKQEELERKLAQRKKMAADARDKRLEEERRELIRLKQGVIEESETIHEEQEQEVKQGFFKRIGSFFYLNKWWLGTGAVFAAIAVFLVFNLLDKPHPDMEILLIGENYSMGYESTLEDYISSFAEDYNGNGEVFAMVNYIPYTGEDQHDYANGVQSKLTSVLQSDESVIVIGNAKAAEIMNAEGTFTDLTSLYPDNPHIKGDKFMLDGTDFAEKIGLSSEVVTDDWFIAIRTPKKLAFSNEKKMQEIYVRDIEVFDAIIRDLSE